MKTFPIDEPERAAVRRAMAPTIRAKVRPLHHVLGFAAAVLLGACDRAELLVVGVRFAVDSTVERPLFSDLAVRPLLLKRAWRRGGIWRVWQQDRLLDRSGNERERLQKLSGLQTVRYALQFSLLSAFNMPRPMAARSDWACL